MLLGAMIGAAERSVHIVTPYFLPPPEMRAALTSAALRGVDVVVIVPEMTNLRYIDAATRRMVGPLIESGVTILRQPAPFSHSKLMMVDGEYALVGSANIDPRSLRLNFEVAIEVVDRNLSATLELYLGEIVAKSREYSLREIEQRSVFRRLLDGILWLFSPYL